MVVGDEFTWVLCRHLQKGSTMFNLSRWVKRQRMDGRRILPAARSAKTQARKSSRLMVEGLETRLVPATIDVTGAGAVATSLDGNVTMTHVTMNPTGSGVIQPFLRIHSQNSEQGYNTSYRQG